MIYSAPLTTAQKFILRQQSNRSKKGNSNVSRFQYKVIVLFHQKLKTLFCICVKVLNAFKILLAGLLTYIIPNFLND